MVSSLQGNYASSLIIMPTPLLILEIMTGIPEQIRVFSVDAHFSMCRSDTSYLYMTQVNCIMPKKLSFIANITTKNDYIF